MQSKNLPFLVPAIAPTYAFGLEVLPFQRSSVCFSRNFKSFTIVQRQDIKSRRLSNRLCGMRVVRACLDAGNVDDRYYMKMCVELARKALGWTSPNPMVGCVIVKEGEIVGQGFHPRAGQPHAEVFALRDAGSLAENATAYVSLEPCNHYGRTPPCTEALINANVKKVVIGMVDPNPIVSSKGLDRLRSAGIEVVTGVEEELCRKLNEGYIHQMLTGKPYVTLRCSISSNGHLMNVMGDQASEQGRYYSKMLQEYDAVIVSSSLVENFSFPASIEPGANQPVTILLAKSRSSGIRIPHLTNEVASRVAIFKDNVTTVDPAIIEQGVETIILEPMNLHAILEYCKRRGLCSVLIDLRGTLDEFEELLHDAVENTLQKVVCELLPTYADNEINTFLHGSLKTIIDKLQLKASASDKSATNVVEVYI